MAMTAFGNLIQKDWVWDTFSMSLMPYTAMDLSNIRGGWETRPELGLLYAIPNGGKRAIKTAIALKAQGVKSGVPDMCLPVARGGYHGLYIELKRQKGGVVSETQKSWITALAEQGYKAVVCRGADEAIGTIKEYLQ